MKNIVDNLVKRLNKTLTLDSTSQSYEIMLVLLLPIITYAIRCFNLKT